MFKLSIIRRVSEVKAFKILSILVNSCLSEAEGEGCSEGKVWKMSFFGSLVEKVFGID